MKVLPLLLAAAVITAGAPAIAAQKAGDLVIGHAWSRAAAAGMNGAGYVTFANKGGAPDVLLGVESPVATRVEIHRASTAGGVARMTKVNKLAVPPGASVVLKPGGDHLMLLRLKKPLKAGDKVPATFVFERAGRVPVTLTVHAGAKHGAH